ncbi:outer membrane protein [Aquicoccus sp. G2-2]|uniref:outer membrane protein n=1 Tax=Aquicoccus sp. G2-2 TaxID=3092120 RepID=UPI002ADF2C07|nr:outer membrane beta-barrel protein [Aquicoccus sp. G2-2]MEA1112543.1 outer membrane beta-barrel protein [Aquicoccus sp. G2-2]
MKLVKLTGSCVIGAVAAFACAPGAQADSGASQYHVTLLAGASDKASLNWDSLSYSMDSGRSYALGISRNLNSMPNLELGVELAHTKAEYSCCAPHSLSGTSLLARAQYNVAVSNAVDLYGALGLGAVNVTYKNTTVGYTNRDTVAGGLLALGASAKVAPSVRLVTELRYVGVFTNAKVAGPGAIARAEYRNTNLNIGVRFSF